MGLLRFIDIQKIRRLGDVDGIIGITLPIAAGAFSDLFQRVGPGYVPITDAADPLSSFVNPVGNPWYQVAGPSPLVNIDSAADEAVFESTEKQGGLDIAGFPDIIEIVSSAWTKSSNPAAAPQELKIFALDSAQLKGVFFLLAANPGVNTSVLAAHFDASTGPPIVTPFISTSVPFTASGEVVKFAKKPGTIGLKIGANAVSSAAMADVFNFDLFAFAGSDPADTTEHRIADIAGSPTVTII